MHLMGAQDRGGKVNACRFPAKLAAFIEEAQQDAGITDDELAPVKTRGNA